MEATHDAKITLLLGTRPEVIKLAPVAHALLAKGVTPRLVSTGQHADLVPEFAAYFGLRIDDDLGVGTKDQSITDVCYRTIQALQPKLAASPPDVLCVQGDTTSAMAGALAAFYQKVPVAHIEAGLRSNNRMSPFPEEMNRVLISRLASLHFAATPRNADKLCAEGVAEGDIVMCGNPVVDAVQWAIKNAAPSKALKGLLDTTEGLDRIVLTTHRRESFGEVMEGRIKVLRDFVERHERTALIFPVHPNPNVTRAANAHLEDHPRIRMIAPLGYLDFIHLLAHAWLIVSDSGGVQEEAPTLGKPVLVIRDTTERMEAIDAKVARLVGASPDALQRELEALFSSDWTREVASIPNPFGDGQSGARIADRLLQQFGGRA